MRKFFILLFICYFSVAITACSDDSSSEPSPSNNDLTDVADTHSADTEDVATPDTDVTEEEEVEEDPKPVTGEACPSECHSLDGGTGDAACAGCQGGYCVFPTYDSADNYCTKRCNNDFNCRSLGDNWKCEASTICVLEE